MKVNFNLSRVKANESCSRLLLLGHRLIFLGLIALWFVMVSCGLWVLWNYENTPGVGAEPLAMWPTDSRIQRASDRDTLVMLAHPHCPCTRASIGELSLLMAHSQGRLRAYVLFLKPAGFSEDWEKTDLWQSAASIPGVTVMIDEEGLEARRFHSVTSGQAILYDAEGRLLFRGGITGSRGHAGDNAGRSAIEALVNTGIAERTETAVFGCPLFNPNSECQGSNDESKRH